MLKHSFILKQLTSLYFYNTSNLLSYSSIENHFEPAVKETIFQNKCVRNWHWVLSPLGQLTVRPVCKWRHVCEFGSYLTELIPVPAISYLTKV